MTALDPSKQGIEAQKLISISLGKMAASRVNKSGSSLHKSLLVASVLHRARNVFLEENYHYHFRGPTIAPVPMYAPHVPPPPCPPKPSLANDENIYLATQEELAPCKDEGVLSRVPFSDASNHQNQRSVSLKRRRCVSDKETQDAVFSILPKRFRTNSDNDSSLDDQVLPAPVNSQEDLNIHVTKNVLPTTCGNENSPVTVSATTESLLHVTASMTEDVLRNATTTTTMNPIYCTLEPISDDEEDDDDANSMEVEHITSLVSIFSFGAPRKDLCATQAAREEQTQFTPVALAV